MNNKQAEGNPKIIKISGYVLGLIGVALTIFGVYFINLAMESSNWSEAQAKISASSVRWRYVKTGSGVKSESDKQYYYELTYDYNVNDMPYTSQRYSLGSGFTASDMFNDREDAVKELNQLYPTGKGITIYYNPEEPYSAVISKGLQGSTYVPVCLGIFFTATAILLVIAGKRIETQAI